MRMKLRAACPAHDHAAFRAADDDAKIIAFACVMLAVSLTDDAEIYSLPAPPAPDK